MTELDAPDHTKIREFYNTEYYTPGTATGDLSWHMRRIAGRLGDLRGKEVLDVACGAGEWLSELVSRGARPSGIDISARAVELARNRLPQADIREGIAETLPFADDSFDLVTCMGSLEHFLDQAGALREMRRVGRAGANYLLLVPNAGFLTRRLGFYRGTGQVAVRETVRPLDEWSQLLQSAGLEVLYRWRDLHPLSAGWVFRGSPWSWLLRAGQAAMLGVWPLAWQYQVYFLCREGGDPSTSPS
jgi:SAM-dependent methyltransferase